VTAVNTRLSPNNLATMKHMGREFVVFFVNESELDQLGAAYNSVHFGLFGIFLGVLVAVGITWIVQASTSITPLSTRLTLVYLVTTIMASGFALQCGLTAWREYGRSSELISRIKAQSKPLD
jgi:hypothetical protein